MRSQPERIQVDFEVNLNEKSQPENIQVDFEVNLNEKSQPEVNLKSRK